MVPYIIVYPIVFNAHWKLHPTVLLAWLPGLVWSRGLGSSESRDVQQFQAVNGRYVIYD